VEDRERIYILSPKVMDNYCFFFTQVLVLSAFILVLYRILSLPQFQG